ncbi:MAG TPA: efflux transporter outer membrane subunit [Candidatus Acidoferrales bacterium]|nr:efflux transporter outer membrane subunit [Candidatus Acidoferrales bacterium]
MMKIRGTKSATFATTIFSCALFLGGCTVGPNYKRPNTDVPTSYRTLPPAEPVVTPPANSSTQSVGDQKWWEVFQDEQLQKLIRTALQQNFDARIAATRVLELQAQLGITRANQYPNIRAIGTGVNLHNPAQGPFPSYGYSQGEIGISGSWDIDFWGKYRRATEAARANLLATNWAQQEVNSTLVANVAAAFFQLRELDLELDISQKALASRKESLDLTKTLEEHGINSILDVRQAEQLVYTADAEITDLTRRIAQQENLISVLLGNNPGPIEPRGKELVDQPHPPAVPAGLPSALLERRPDIRQSEQLLTAANAQIGVARAAYFPDVALTGTTGFQSASLTSLFSGPAGLWTFAANVTQPIFNAGQIRSNVRLAQAQQQEAVLTYQQAIQGAFRDVSDALIAYQQNQQFRAQEELLANSAQDAAQLSNKRYEAGTTNYLEVLTNQTNYFSSELGLAQARLNELLSLVQIYKSLGGGWQQ